MWLPDPMPIELSRNSSISIGIELFDDIENKPIDITGCTLTCNVAISDGGSLINSPNVLINDAVNGLFEVKFNGSDYNIVLGKKETVTLSYEVKIQNGANTVVALRGPIFLVPGIL